MFEFKGEKEFLNYVRANSDIGFGRMMQIISFYWHEKDSTGAFISGPCYGSLDSQEAAYHEDVKRSDPLNYSLSETEKYDCETCGQSIPVGYLCTRCYTLPPAGDGNK